MKLEDKLIKLRKEKGISQEELGNEINVSRQAISKWELGQTKPDIEKIKDIAKFYNKSYEYLLNDELDEDIKIENNKKDRNITKTILKIVSILITLYLVISIYKFIILTIFINIANSFSEENYRIFQSCFSENAYGEVSKINIHIEKIGDYAKKIIYLKDDNEEYCVPNCIDYIDLKNKVEDNYYYNILDNSYRHTQTSIENFDSKEDYDNYFENFNYAPGKMAVETLPNNIVARIAISFNPFYKVSFLHRMISYKYQDITYEVYLTKDYLIDNIKFYSDINGKIVNQFSYDYVPEHFNNKKIENPINEYKDIMIIEE